MQVRHALSSAALGLLAASALLYLVAPTGDSAALAALDLWQARMARTLPTPLTPVHPVAVAVELEGTLSSPTAGGATSNNIANHHNNNNRNTAPTTTFVYVGCFRISAAHRLLHEDGGKDNLMTPSLCASKCAARGFALFEVTGRFQCFCGHAAYLPSDAVPAAECSFPCGGNRTLKCGGRWRGGLHRVTSPVKPVLTVFVEPARNRGSLFLSGRFRRWTSDHYIFHLKPLNSRVTSSPEAFLRATCRLAPGLKFFVGHAELVLGNWPGNSIWAITGDETGDWGLVRNGKHIGLHGPGAPFPTNTSAPLQHIVLPEFARPWYRQYYDSRQVRAFHGSARFMPLGSRIEFPSLDPADARPMERRKYVFMYVAGGTDPSRKQLYDFLQTKRALDAIPEAKRFIHFAALWQANSNGALYLNSTQYAAVMQDSMFCFCPKGHSVEQFRLYEAIESGAIPVFENKDNYLRDKMPPEYLASPMLFVDDWRDAPRAMSELAADVAALQARQRALLAWYDAFMRAFFLSLERDLEAKRRHGPGQACQAAPSP